MEAWFGLRAQETAEACERALEHLERSGRSGSRLEHLVRNRLIASFVYVPLPVDDSIERIRALGAGHGPLEQAWERGVIGRLYAMKGDFARARELVPGAFEAYNEAGLLQSAGAIAMGVAHTEWLAGDDSAAERAFREGLAVLEGIGDRAYYPTSALRFAALLYEQGRLDEVRHWYERARETTGHDDFVNFLFFDMLDACLYARDGRHAEAEAAVSRVVERMEQTDFSELQIYAHRFVAEAFALMGRADEAREHVSQALSVAAAKGDVAFAARVREQMSALGVEVA